MWTELTQTSIKERFMRVNQLEFERINPALNRQSNQWSVNEGILNKNAGRNRYTNVIPWDYTRVKLPVKPGGNDYINASHIKLGEDLNYIATQGPKDQTVHHFWSMCFAEADKRGEDHIIVVMITPLVENNVIKCCKYWPDHIDKQYDFTQEVNDDEIDISGLKVSYKKETEFPDYVLTELQLTGNGKVKTVWHFHFKNWADSRVPLNGDSLSELLNAIKEYQHKYKVTAPVVHCSAGVGRSGTFIALDYLKNHPQVLMDKSSSVDPIYEVFRALRDQRLMMIQTVHQYIFLYDYFKRLLNQK